MQICSAVRRGSIDSNRMKRRVHPNPILDAREVALVAALQKDFEDFAEPDVIGRGLKKIGSALERVTPSLLKKAFSDAKSMMHALLIIQKSLETAEKGFHLLTQQASRMTISKQGVVEKLSARGAKISTFEEVCLMRSYHIEAVLEDKTFQDTLLAAFQGAATGFFGFAGLPFNLALSFFLYFRAAQNIALHYGYDVKGDPRELQFAAEVTLQSLDPNFSGKGLGGLIGKMMLLMPGSRFKRRLSTLSYTATEGSRGSEMLYVQLRAVANKAAERALAKAGQEGIEAGIFKSLLAQLTQRIPREAGRRAVPIAGAIVGGLSDAYFMTRILRGAKLIYHKRYLFEKAHRISLLEKPPAPQKRPQKKAGAGKTSLPRPARGRPRLANGD